MSGKETIHLSSKDASLVLTALTIAEVAEQEVAEQYERSAEYHDGNFRDELLLIAADCRTRSEEYQRIYETVRREVLA